MHPLGFPSIAERGFVTVQFRELDFRECHVFARALAAHTIVPSRFQAKLFEAQSAPRSLWTRDENTRARCVTRAFTRAGSWTAVLKLFPRENGMDVCSNRRRDSTDVSRRDAKLSHEQIYAPRCTSIASITRRCQNPDYVENRKFLQHGFFFFASETDFIPYILR